ncbi:MAG: helix-turn-helix domain-containing protein [Ligilactobacillus ruminis]
MKIYDRIRLLASEKNISIRELEIKLGFSNGLLRSWDKSTNTASLEKVADYFDVSIDCLLGRTSKQELPKELELSANAPFLWEGMPFSDADQELLKNIAARLANK